MPASTLRRALGALVLVLAAGSAPAADAPVQLPGARQFELASEATGQRYRVFVSEPDAPAPAAGYPVLYVLDGNAAFPMAAFLARSVASRREVTGQPPVLVVGIGYPGDADFDVAARRRDYTVGVAEPGAAGREGGAERFLDFVERELKPQIAARHPVDARRQALFGHSFGGLLVLHAAFTRPASFTTFLASSPSIWWNERRVLDGLARPAAAAPRLQISVGALEDAPPPGRLSAETLALLARRPMVSDARALAARLQALPAWQGRVAFHEFEGENHGWVWLPALSRGMQFFLQPSDPQDKDTR
ncbi:putative alpha/beta superfamily hydrolase [Rubrivivax gelatinosus]|uniref:alpha/beta hydrolase n=1 Tax=Rubrivivax gelatinosus TaxID=28068 RepID=UPI0018CB5C08|nr:alpha/beta hydrolase-fold protein [Rubrivivax gelatinosus]MBG6082965.1 putative alpha/beta superfamily hydrolase [Rubrivivax gelatinosus]